MPSAIPRAALTRPLDQFADALDAERCQRRPDRHPARAAGELGDHLERIHGRRREQVAGVQAHRPVDGVGVGHDRDAAVVGRVQRLVRVRRPRVGAGHARGERRQRRLDSCPQAERAVDVHPGAGVARDLHDRTRTGRTRPSGCCPPARTRSPARPPRPAPPRGPRRPSGPGRRRRRSPGAPAPGSAARGRPTRGLPRPRGPAPAGLPPARRRRRPSRRRSSTRPRAAARQVKLADVAPVVKPTADPDGRPSSPSSQRAATSSVATTPGVASRMPAFWSQAATSQSAAIATGSAPPMTQP